jgi:hypothetical protein
MSDDTMTRLEDYCSSRFGDTRAAFERVSMRALALSDESVKAWSVARSKLHALEHDRLEKEIAFLDHVEHIVRAYPPTGEGGSIGLDYVCPRTGERKQWRRWEPFRVEVPGPMTRTR